MKSKITIFSILILFANLMILMNYSFAQQETKEEHDSRMQWWRDARFGLFIHWGLYSIPAGEWKEGKDYGEWIRTSAKIPLEEYDKFVRQFNPVKFNASEFVRMAKEAGMKYIVITSKHHDGFCLFDSKYTDFDVMATPFHRDLMKELSDACRKEGIKMCWYHSIMDWHHPDYLPRREWEKNRSTEGAVFDRYVQHMKNQLKELLTNYGDIGVLWFDGEWENTWNTKYGNDLYDYVRKLQPKIIINNRVGAGRSGMEGFTKEGEFAGDFGTPEQEIPATGVPGVDWETCMTMNDHWGYNKNDMNWKSSEDLIHKLADIASKGGNFLLNIGPTSEGLFPQASIDRLKEIGQWMKVNGESIYGTQASPFKELKWGRCTQKAIDGGTRLYLHVFDWPSDGKLILPEIFNKIKQSFLLSNHQKVSKINVVASENENFFALKVPNEAPDKYNSVIVLDVAGKPDVAEPPSIESDYDIFVNALEVKLKTERNNVEVRFTLDGSIPTINSNLSKVNIHLTETTIITARCFRNKLPVSGSTQKKFIKVVPGPSTKIEEINNGIKYRYFEGDWEKLPDFSNLKSGKEGILYNFNFSPRKQVDYFGFEYSGFINIPEDDVYMFFTASDDGSRLSIDDKIIVDNDGLHGTQEKNGIIALAKGFHSYKLIYFDKTGGDDLRVYFMSPKIKKQLIPDEILFYKR